MKFQSIPENENAVFDKKTDVSKIDLTEDNIATINRYDNVAVVLMKPGTKGDFFNLSTLINDGVICCSWTIRVFYTQGQWNAQLAPHRDVRKNIDVNLFDLISYLSDNKEVIVHSSTHVASFKTQNEKFLQDIINALIGELKDNRISGIEQCEVNKKYSIENSKLPYVIMYNIHKSSSNAKTKYNLLYELLVDRKIDVSSVNMNKLDVEDKKEILILSKKFLTQSDRIKIAMKFINLGDEDEESDI